MGAIIGVAAVSALAMICSPIASQALSQSAAGQFKIPKAPAFADCESLRAEMTKEGDNWDCTRVTIAKGPADIGGRPNPTCSDRAFVSCSTMTVDLPLGAQVVGVEYFHLSAPRPAGDAIWHWNAPNFDLVYAWQEPAYQRSTPSNIVVEAVFKNWATGWEREAGLGVRWRKHR